jgi:hypothetical protein
MTNSITPPPEMVQQWLDTLFEQGGLGIDAHKLSMGLAARAAQWGADQELEAIQKEIITQAWFADPRHRLAQLRAARRPNPPSLKQQALDRCNDYIDPDGIIRRALEALDD